MPARIRVKQIIDIAWKEQQAQHVLLSLLASNFARVSLAEERPQRQGDYLRGCLSCTTAEGSTDTQAISTRFEVT